MSSDKDHYPTTDELKIDACLSYLPKSLKDALDLMFSGKDTRRKVASIGQAIIQATRPRSVLTPLQIGLGVQIHQHCRSKFIVDSLFEMGFSASYKETVKFEKNAADGVETDIFGPTNHLEDKFVLFALDNVDHNIITLDGKGSFHGMGSIASFTPAYSKRSLVSRKKIKELDISKREKINIIEYKCEKHACHVEVFKELPMFLNCCKSVDIMWEVALKLKSATPLWQGFMHILHHRETHPGKSSVQFLPMVDMYSGDETCIFSTLNFVSGLSKRYGIPTVVTLDQPLFWKASEIILDSPKDSHIKDIVLMLGSFHLLMNLLGAIGYLMEGSGLKEILETVYGENAITYMMTGKSVQRAIRGHLLVEKSLNGLVTEEIVKDNDTMDGLLDEVDQLYSSFLCDSISLSDITSSEVLQRINILLKEKKSEISERSRTSKLWILYTDMIETARSLIRADRSGSWLLHLQTISNALPIFAAAGHFNYLRSSHLYLSRMSKLKNTHPSVYEQFLAGHYVSRRSDSFWSGVGSDLLIEQTLMRSVKSTGGLTRGSGMTEEMRDTWVLAAPALSEYNMAMQDFTGQTYATSEQHRESTDARKVRDSNDLEKIDTKVKQCQPFSNHNSLMNIVNGLVAAENVNVDLYREIGDKIVGNMIGKSVFDHKFKRKDKAITLGSNSSVKVTPDKVIDPALLFQRFLVISKSGDLLLEDVLNHELSQHPPSLFEAKHIPRKADKPQIANSIKEYEQKNCEEECEKSTDRYILDGGSLLHRVPWQEGSTYSEIAKSYAKFTFKNYGCATIIFDGYSEGASTKDSTHLRRGSQNHPQINCTPSTVFKGKKEDFLKNKMNKKNLIVLISEELKQAGCKVLISDEDADVDIVRAAVQQSTTTDTTVICEDTDILILLLHHASSKEHVIYMRSDINKKQRHTYNIKKLKILFGEDICRSLLFIHAFTGCDTTSRIFGVGKKGVFQKTIRGDRIISSCSKIFTSKNIDKEEIIKHGHRMFVHLFGGKEESLSSLRHHIFTKKALTGNIFITPERLPPTASAASFHSLRVYFQIMIWMEMGSDMNPTEWGWKCENNKLKPIMTDVNVAPESLLKVIHCSCLGGCKSMRCSCRRYGLPCTLICGSCQTDHCCFNPNNRNIITTGDDNDNVEYQN